MTESHNSQSHHGPTVKAYLVIFGALSVFTAVSFIFNSLARGGSISHQTSFILILSVAICKATLVGLYFMHLILDWSRLYYLIIPAFILGTLLIVVLLPDSVLAWHQLGVLKGP